ncbi:MAG: CheR family methyltransferase, partial [Chloroflexota bacterium]
AQPPESTGFGGMPRSAIATGLVDFILAPGDMPKQLIDYCSKALINDSQLDPKTSARFKNALMKIFILLRTQTGHDFSLYKPSTVHRRIERRMAVQQIGKIEQYVKYMQKNPLEVDALFHDLLVGLSSFFRDREAFEALEEKVIPILFSSKPRGSVIRIWAVGCSTGEEVYSLAILMIEQMEKLKRNDTIQIFATDIDTKAIAAARTGRFPASITADLTPERLARFFLQSTDGNVFQIHKSIRDMVVFSEQDVVKDPPFSRIDLISCRNLLIYFSLELQQKLLPLFHFALNPAGMLFLGTSEGIGDFSELFSVLDRKSKLYQRKENIQGTQHIILSHFLPSLSAIDAALPHAAWKTEGFPDRRYQTSLRSLTEQAILEQVAPTAALINGDGDILYLHGRSGRFLELAQGEVGINNILKMAREGLKIELTTALFKARKTNETVTVPRIRVSSNNQSTITKLSISPLQSNTSSISDSPLFLVILDVLNEEDAALELINREMVPDSDIQKLLLEMQVKDEYIHSTTLALETTNEELKSYSEEMQSVNEELQSTNEELETATEELQSVNEELNTVNNELGEKVLVLSHSNNDMNNLLSGTGVATIFVDQDLNILRFTPISIELINLIPGDIGRPVGHIANNLRHYDSLIKDIKAVLATLIPKELEVETKTGAWFRLRILPYRTIENVIEGAVITFMDITELKKMQNALQKSEEFIKNLLDNAPVSIYANSGEGKILLVNKKWKEERGCQQELVIGLNLTDIFSKETAAMLAADNQKVLDTGIVLIKEESTESPIEKRQFYTVKFPLHNIYGEPDVIGGISMDITERRLAEEQLRRANELLRLAVVVQDSHDAITVYELDGQMIAWNPAAERMYGWSEAEALLMNVQDRIPEDLRENAIRNTLLLSQAKILQPYRSKRITKTGSILDIWMTATALFNESGKMYAISTTERSI